MQSKDKLAQKIANFIIADGTANTESGTWNITFEEIVNQMVDAVLTEDIIAAIADNIIAILEAHDAVGEACLDADCFEVAFWDEYCAGGPRYTPPE